MSRPLPAGGSGGEPEICSAGVQAEKPREAICAAEVGLPLALSSDDFVTKGADGGGEAFGGPGYFQVRRQQLTPRQGPGSEAGCGFSVVGGRDSFGAVGLRRRVGELGFFEGRSEGAITADNEYYVN